MKKIVILIIFVVILCVGCVTKENQPSMESVIQTTNPGNKNITSLSPNGRYRAEAYGTDNKSLPVGLLYPYEGIRVVNVENNEVLFQMPGYYIVDFAWSPDSRYVGIYYEARIYGESIVFDTNEKKTLSLPTLDDIALHYGENEKPQVVRSDPYFHIVRWEDEVTAVIDFSWNRESSEPFSDTFTFNIITHIVTYK